MVYDTRVIYSCNKLNDGGDWLWQNYWRYPSVQARQIENNGELKNYQSDSIMNNVLKRARLSGGETIKYDGIHAVSVERSVNSDGRVMWNGDYGRDAVSDGVTGYRFDTRLS